tara:strand:+ start:15259 stop:15537 length:279 start_codon:yes stop_codon:yes gene_type:complete
MFNDLVKICDKNLNKFDYLFSLESIEDSRKKALEVCDSLEINLEYENIIQELLINIFYQYKDNQSRAFIFLSKNYGFHQEVTQKLFKKALGI